MTKFFCIFQKKIVSLQKKLNIMAAIRTMKKETRTFAKNSNVEAPGRMSKVAEFWKRYPNGIGTIVDHKAVLK